jgi:hypothetical protein
VTALLWMDEEELRETCHVLLAHLVYEQKRREYLVKMVQEAAADGYRIGYGDAMADRVVRISQAVAGGVEEGFVVH